MVKNDKYKVEFELHLMHNYTNFVLRKSTRYLLFDGSEKYLISMKRFFLLFTVTSFYMMSYAQEKVVLFPQGAPGETKTYIERDIDTGVKVAGQSIITKVDVGNPEITIYPTSDKKTQQTAMIVCPGGGYKRLSYDLEGTEICSWLNSVGITAVLLKYRVPRREGRQKHEAPLQDAQRALSYVRCHAKELNIHPHRIGIMGFSAGAHLSAMTSTSFHHRTYTPFDEVDSISCRPDFCLLVYPAYLSGKNFQLAPEVKLGPDVPPTMIVQAEDDKYYVNSSLFYYYALKEAKIPAWLHLYSEGDHGYGLRQRGLQIDEWPLRAVDWFRELKLIP